MYVAKRIVNSNYLKCSETLMAEERVSINSLNFRLETFPNTNH